MILTGQHTINAPVETIWRLLMNPDVLARITPLINRLELTEENTYKAIADVKIGPVSGSFAGILKVTEQVEPEKFNLVVQQNSRIGNASAVMAMSLIPSSATQTTVGFNGDVKLTGVLNTMGGRVLSPIANMLAKQFFDALAKEVA